MIGKITLKYTCGGSNHGKPSGDGKKSGFEIS